MKYSPNLRTKYLIGALGLILSLGIIIIIFVQITIPRKLEKELIKRALYQTEDLADEIVNPVLNEQLLNLQLLLFQHKDSDEDIKYILYYDEHNRIFAHTFENTIPGKLYGVNEVRQGQKYNIYKLNLGTERIFDIAAPVMKGELGFVRVGYSEKHIINSIKNIQLIIVMITLVVLICGIVLMTAMMTKLINPLYAIIEGAENIGKGYLEYKVNVNTKDEIGLLSEAFNDMSDNLRKSKDSLVKINAELKSEITARKITENNIRLQISRLKTLHSIDKIISSSFDINAVFDILLEQLTAYMGLDAAAILLLNEDTQMLEYVISKGFRTSALKYTKLRLGEGNAGRAAKTGSIINIPDLRNEPDGFVKSKFFKDEEFIAYFAVPLISNNQNKGVIEIFNRSPFPSEPEWQDLLDIIADQIAIYINNITLFNNLQSSNIELVNAYDATIRGWSHALDLKDKVTEGHSQRVMEMTVRIARVLEITEDKRIHIKRGALLHDIGKMGIPDSILLKNGDLTEKEWELMKCHPRYAYDMLYPIEFLRPALDIPYCHHEKWDGTGYPRGLKDEEIPLSARIFSLVDVFDAVTSNRPYRPLWDKEKAIEHIRSLSGIHFDPEIVKVFFDIVQGER